MITFLVHVLGLTN